MVVNESIKDNKPVFILHKKIKAPESSVDNNIPTKFLYGSSSLEEFTIPVLIENFDDGFIVVHGLGIFEE
jgi:hypothetical protein